MRVSKQAVAENRRRILAAAARLFREHGIDGAGVDAITEAAGLTHGAFYSQFASKEAVVVEALRLVLDESNELWAQSANGTDKRAALDRIIDGYLSPRHRDSLGTGCAVAALGSDLPRQSKKVREVFTKRLEEGLDLRRLGAGEDGITSPRHGDSALLGNGGRPDSRARGRRRIPVATDPRDGGERAEDCRPPPITAPECRGGEPASANAQARAPASPT